MRMSAAPVASLRRLEHLQDLGLDRDVERGRRLVGDDHVGVVGDGHGDHHALPHAAGELVRERPRPHRRVGDADQVEQFHGARPGGGLADIAVRGDGLGDLVTDRVDRRQGRERVLEDHGDPVAADLRPLLVAAPEQLLALERRRSAHAGRARQQAHHGHRADRLARAGLADDAEHLALGQRVAQPADGVDRAGLAGERHAEVGDLEQGRRGRCAASRGRRRDSVTVTPLPRCCRSRARRAGRRR